MTTYMFDIETSALDEFKDDRLATLNPFKSRLDIVTYIKLGDHTVHILRGNEKDMLSWFISHFRPNYTGLVGFNTLKFDIPYIQARLTENGWSSDFAWNLVRKYYDFDIRQYFVIRGMRVKGTGLRDISGMTRVKTFNQVDKSIRSEMNKYCYFQMIELASVFNKLVKENQTREGKAMFPYTNITDCEEVNL